MDVGNDALAGGNGAGEFVLDGVPALIARNGGIDLRAVGLIAECGVGAGVNQRAIVGVDDVAGGAAAGSIIARMVVGAGQRKDRIEQAGFLQAEKNGIGSKLGAESALAELHVGGARIFTRIWIADLRALAAAPLEDAQHLARLPGCP